ncbi:MAG: nitroreductase family protein [Candidatus Heimdallarchaeota archaeon]
MDFEKSIEETIRKRYSCRTYINEKLDEKSIEKINEFLQLSEKGPFNNSVKFILVDTKKKEEKLKIGTYGMISGARYFIVGIMNKKSINFTDFGYLMEKIILKATELDYGTVWLGRAFNTNTFSNLVDLEDNEIIPAISPIGNIAQDKRNFDKIISWGIKARKRKAWAELFFDSQFAKPLTAENSTPYTLALEMLRLAPSARNKQPWRIVRENKLHHFYLKTQSRYIMEVFESMGLIDIGIAMCHFELTSKENQLKGKWMIKDPQLDTQPKSYKYIATWVSK